MYKEGNKHELWWHWKRLRYIMSFLTEIFEKNRIITFADIGCAEGLYVKYVSSIHDETFCIGADLTRAFVEKAKGNSKIINTEYVVCDARNLPFKDGSIDLLLCSEVLEHIQNYHKSLDELFRVANKYLVISFPGHSYIYKVISKIKPLKKIADNLVLDVGHVSNLKVSDVQRLAHARYAGHVSDVKVSDVQELLKGKDKCLKIKIGAALPLMLFEIIPSVRLVDMVDNAICKVLENLGAIDYTTIHVVKVTRRCI
jgi:SAM-dependent methyltransferase